MNAQKTTGILTPVQERAAAAVYPNPVIDQFNLEFELPEKTFLQIAIMDATGKMVKNLYNGWGKRDKNRLTFVKNAL